MKKRDPIFYDKGKRWKKLKIASLFSAFLFSFIIVFTLFSYLDSPFKTNNRLNDAQVETTIEEINTKEKYVRGKGSFITLTNIHGEENIRRFGKNKKQVVLTFDDGPDPEFTEKILRVLTKEKVNGTFFVVGEQMYKYPIITQKIIDQGSTIGMHTFSHIENPMEEKLSKLEFIKELDLTEKMFIHLIEYKPLIFRIPYVGTEDKLSYNALQYVGETYKRGFSISAPTIDSFDWKEDSTEKEIIKRSTRLDILPAVILFHDAGGKRDATVNALPEIIKYYKENGYEFTTVDKLAEQNNLAVSAPITYWDKISSSVIFNTYNLVNKTPNLLKQGFILGFIIVLLHTSVVLLLVITHKLKHIFKKNNNGEIKYKGLVSVIIPMHNEEKSIKATIHSVLKSSYKKIEIIVVDNGSSDQSFEKANEIKSKKVKVMHQEKAGKYAALNYGVMLSKGKIIICIDADTQLRASSINQIVHYFADKKVGAVAGHIIVGNPRNFLTRLQNLEYTITQSVEKRVSDVFGAVPVVPGAYGAWRKSALVKAGKFNKRTHAEDFELTVRIIKLGYSVKYAEKSAAYTEAPETLEQLFIQRLRWNFGNLQVVFKHKDVIFNKKYGFFGLFLFPRYAILQIPSILLNPVVDVFIIMNLLFGERMLTIVFFSLYLALQFAVVVLAFLFSQNKNVSLAHFIFLRFPYAQIMYIVLFFAIFKAFKGEILAWTKLQHTGKMTVVKA